MQGIQPVRFAGVDLIKVRPEQYNATIADIESKHRHVLNGLILHNSAGKIDGFMRIVSVTDADAIALGKHMGAEVSDKLSKATFDARVEARLEKPAPPQPPRNVNGKAHLTRFLPKPLHCLLRINRTAKH